MEHSKKFLWPGDLFWIVSLTVGALMVFYVLFHASTVFGSTTWTANLAQINVDMANIPAGCIGYLEKYSSGGSNAYRLWRRCNMTGVDPGTRLSQLEFPNVHTIIGWGEWCETVSVTYVGDGTDYPCNGAVIYGGAIGSDDAGVTIRPAYWAQGYYNEKYYALDCMGYSTTLTSTPNGLTSAKAKTPTVYVDSTGPNLALCRSGDILIADYGVPTASNCNFYGLQISGYAGGVYSNSLTGNADCTPIGYGATSVSSDGSTATFEPLWGDPASLPITLTGDAIPGDLNGGSFTITGSNSGGGAFNPQSQTGVGYSETCSGGSCSTPAVNASVGSGVGAMVDIQGGLNAEASGPSGIPGPPSVPGYSGGDTPSIANWVSRISSFLASSPALNILNGTTLSLSGESCNIDSTFSWGGHSIPLIFDFCQQYITDGLTMLGGVLVAFAYLDAALIVFWR